MNAPTATRTRRPRRVHVGPVEVTVRRRADPLGLPDPYFAAYGPRPPRRRRRGPWRGVVALGALALVLGPGRGGVLAAPSPRIDQYGPATAPYLLVGGERARNVASGWLSVLRDGQGAVLVTDTPGHPTVAATAKNATWVLSVDPASTAALAGHPGLFDASGDTVWADAQVGCDGRPVATDDPRYVANIGTQLGVRLTHASGRPVLDVPTCVP